MTTLFFYCNIIVSIIRYGGEMIRYRLTKLKTIHNTTFSEISNDTGLSLSTLNKVANNENVEIKIVDKLLNYFGCSPNDLIIHTIEDQ